MALWACLSPGEAGGAGGCGHCPGETRRLRMDSGSTEETWTIPFPPLISKPHIFRTEQGSPCHSAASSQPSGRWLTPLPRVLLDLRAMQTQGHLVDSCWSQPGLGGMASFPGTRGPRALHPDVSRTSEILPTKHGCSPLTSPGLCTHLSRPSPIIRFCHSLPPRPWNFPPAHVAGCKAVIE